MINVQLHKQNSFSKHAVLANISLTLTGHKSTAFLKTFSFDTNKSGFSYIAPDIFANALSWNKAQVTLIFWLFWLEIYFILWWHVLLHYKESGFKWIYKKSFSCTLKQNVQINKLIYLTWINENERKLCWNYLTQYFSIIIRTCI